jgi:hypothetical protein
VSVAIGRHDCGDGAATRCAHGGGRTAACVGSGASGGAPATAPAGFRVALVGGVRGRVRAIDATNRLLRRQLVVDHIITYFFFSKRMHLKPGYYAILFPRKMKWSTSGVSSVRPV